jgi:hypothetical protein
MPGIVSAPLKGGGQTPKMQDGMGSNGASGKKRNQPRFVFQIDSDSEGAVIRVLDTYAGTVFREVPVEQFVAYARNHKDVKRFLLGQVS